MVVLLDIVILFQLTQVVSSCYTTLGRRPRFGFLTCNLTIERAHGTFTSAREVPVSGRCSTYKHEINGGIEDQNCMVSELFNLDVCDCASAEKTDHETCRTKSGFTIEEVEREQKARYASNAPPSAALCHDRTVYLDADYGGDVCKQYWTSDAFEDTDSAKVVCEENTLFAMGLCECVDAQFVHSSNCTIKHPVPRPTPAL